VVDGIARLLGDVRGRRPPRTRILTVDEAREQIETVARVVETTLPDSGTDPSPAIIAAQLRYLATQLRARNWRGHVRRDSRRGDRYFQALSRQFDLVAADIRHHMDEALRPQIEPIIRGVLESTGSMNVPSMEADSDHDE